jgi:serine/threonine-protein kinase
VTLTVSKGRGTVIVPQVQGFTLARAEAAIRKARLRVGKVQSINDTQYPPGEVSSTSPFAGQPEPPGTPVNLFVSAGPAKKTVPNVTGQTESAATSALKAAGFTVNPVTTISSQPPGTVVSQSPAPGTQAAPGSVVTIDVAKAAPPPPTATVPSVSGDTVAAARSALKAAGFTVAVTFQTVTSKSQDGVVLSQSPAAGSSAKKGSTVTIVVGRYKKQTHTTPTTPTTP